MTTKISVFLLLIFITDQQSTAFTQFKNDMQQKVINLANAMIDAYGRRCQNDVKECSIKSINKCQGTHQKICFDDFPKPGQCLSGGAYMSENTTINFPNSVDVSRLSDEQKQFVCSSALLEDEFQKLNDGRDYKYGIAYIGTILGSFRQFPSSRSVGQQQCVDYDPRFRPWYVIATSGAKNVILIIDTSGSMSGSRLDIAKEAGKSVVNTLSNNDFVGVISFNSEVQSLYSNKVLRATDQVKQGINAQIDALEANGSTNYEQAYRKGFRILDAATKDEFGAPCSDAQNIFLFLTDGQPTAGAQTSSELILIIDSYNINYDITLFTYGFGSGIDTSILQDLACRYNGILFQIDDTATKTQFATIMRNYYTYISEGTSITRPVWTQPYQDAFGFGRMVTASIPIYYEERGIRKILGVAGIDVIMQTFSYFGINQQTDVIKELIKNAPCNKGSLTECQIQSLRNQSLQCPGIICNSANTSIINCAYTTNTVFRDPINYDTYKCCGLALGAFIAIIVIVVIVVIVIIIIVIVKVKSHLNNRNRQQQQIPQINNNPGSDVRIRPLNPNPYFNNPNT